MLGNLEEIGVLWLHLRIHVALFQQRGCWGMLGMEECGCKTISQQVNVASKCMPSCVLGGKDFSVQGSEPMKRSIAIVFSLGLLVSVSVANAQQQGLRADPWQSVRNPLNSQAHTLARGEAEFTWGASATSVFADNCCTDHKRGGYEDVWQGYCTESDNLFEHHCRRCHFGRFLPRCGTCCQSSYSSRNGVIYEEYTPLEGKAVEPDVEEEPKELPELPTASRSNLIRMRFGRLHRGNMW